MIQHLEPSAQTLDNCRAWLAHAKWLWPQKPLYDNFNTYARFRRTLELNEVPAELWAAISADQSYQLRVNDRLVCRGPARGYQASWPFDVVDLAPFLDAGDNTLEARVYFPSESSFFYLCRSFPGFIFAAEWDGGRLYSDESWLARLECETVRFTRKASTQLFRQEHFDLRRTPGEDAWGKPFVHHSFTEPWPDMEPRGIPMLRESVIDFWTLLGKSRGASAPGWERTEDVVALRVGEGHGHEPCANAPQLEGSGSGADGFESFLIDFGKVHCGSLELEMEGSGGCVDVLYAETADANTLALELELDGWNHLAMGSRVWFREGGGTHRLYHPYGFRYAVVTVRGADAAFRLRLRLHTTGYPIERRGGFHHSDPQWNAIWETCAWTQEICSMDAFVDTPWREQAQWWGDARVQGENLHWLMGDARLLRRGIRIIGAQRTADGVTYGHAPTMAHRCVLPDFALTWILTLWDHYWQTGSLDAWRSEQVAVNDVLGYFRKHFDPEKRLVRHDPRYWLFLDWAPVFKGAYPAILSFQLLEALQAMERMARLDGASDRAGEFNAWAREVTAGLRALRDAEGWYADGLDEQGAPTDVRSVHSQLMAVQLGVEPEPDRAWLERSVLPALREEDAGLVKPNLFWQGAVFEFLAQRGFAREVLDHIRRVWGPMVPYGSTLECADLIPNRLSCSHAWSAHPLNHLMKIFGGVRQTGPAWSRAVLEPLFEGEACDVRVPTPAGVLRVNWQRRDNAVTLEADVPEGIELVAGNNLPEPGHGIPAGSHRWTLTP